MQAWGERIFSARMKRGLTTQQALAGASGISLTIINKAEKAQTPNEITFKSQVRLAKFFGISHEELVGGYESEPPSPQRRRTSVKNLLPTHFRIPRVSTVAASDFREADVDVMNEDGVAGELYPYPNHDPVVVRVVGSSMVWDHPDSLIEGDDVIIANELDEEIPENAIVVAKHMQLGTQTVKRLHYVNSDTIELVPHNPGFPTLRADRSEVILRKVKVFIRYEYKRR